MLELQSVVLAAGRGSRLPSLGGGVCKCLLPVGPYPVLYYSLHMLETIGFTETMIIVLDEDKSNVSNALEKCPLKIKYDLIPIPSDEDWGTADSLRHVSSRVLADLMVVSGDLITNVDLHQVVEIYRKHDASIVSVFFDNGPEEWIELPGPKTKVKPERDIIGIDKETQRLVFLASASDFEENFTMPRALVKKFDSVTLHSRLLDSHIYIMKKWVVNFLVDEGKFSTIKGELIPYVVKKQLSKPNTDKKTTSERNIDIKKDIFTYAAPTGYETMIRDMSSYNDHVCGYNGVYQGDTVRCYAYVPDKQCFGMRINTLSSFYLVNSKIIERWEEVTGAALAGRLHADCTVRSRQLDDASTVGEKSVVSEKTSIQRSFIGAGCTVDSRVRLANCILMNNVTVREGCVLQDTVLYTGATVESGCNLQHCLVGPHHTVPAGTSATHQILSETTDDMITLG